jgi:hypothetical protein
MALDDVVILNVDTNTLETPFDDLQSLPNDVVMTSWVLTPVCSHHGSEHDFGAGEGEEAAVAQHLVYSRSTVIAIVFMVLQRKLL